MQYFTLQNIACRPYLFFLYDLSNSFSKFLSFFLSTKSWSFLCYHFSLTPFRLTGSKSFRGSSCILLTTSMELFYYPSFWLNCDQRILNESFSLSYKLWIIWKVQWSSWISDTKMQPGNFVQSPLDRNAGDFFGFSQLSSDDWKEGIHNSTFVCSSFHSERRSKIKCFSHIFWSSFVGFLMMIENWNGTWHLKHELQVKTVKLCLDTSLPRLKLLKMQFYFHCLLIGAQ